MRHALFSVVYGRCRRARGDTSHDRKHVLFSAHSVLTSANMAMVLGVLMGVQGGIELLVASVVWAKFYGKRNSVNLGIGGDRTQHVIWRLDHGNLAGITPKLAVIMIGTNNSRDNSPEQIAEGITIIVNQLKDKTPDTKVLLLAVFPRGASSNDARRQVNEKTNVIVSKLNDGKRVFYLDIGKDFLQEDGTLTKEIMPDLLHLSEKGYTIWAESIEPMVAKLMSP